MRFFSENSLRNFGCKRPCPRAKREWDAQKKGRAVVWSQNLLTLTAPRRGLHLITGRVVESLPELASVRVGLLHLLLQHTSASLTLNENADPDVRVDLDRWLDQAAPETMPFAHTLEGPDDMPAHIKSSLMGCSLTLPIRQGRLALGTWQGIYLCEHRDHPTPRRIVLTLQGTSE